MRKTTVGQRGGFGEYFYFFVIFDHSYKIDLVAARDEFYFTQKLLKKKKRYNRKIVLLYKKICYIEGFAKAPECFFKAARL
jgi:hypothetical protein